MHLLRVEHPVPEYEAWKRMFDSDPVGREKSGVRTYRVQRSSDDPNYVLIDLEFDSLAEAEAMRDALRELWGRMEGPPVIDSPQARITEVVESHTF
jgi:hypothetical protein